MNIRHCLVVALVVWIILSFMPSLLLTSLIGKGRVSR
jgi:hypothetical protein